MANTIVLASISVIILVLSPLTTANTRILDTNGNPLEPDSQYYIRAPFSGFGRGGITARMKGPRLCPLYVGQHDFWSGIGMPLIILPTNTTENEITSGMPVNIMFAGPSICRNSNVWQIRNPRGESSFVTNDGTLGNHESSTFEIRDTDFTYKIVFCTYIGKSLIRECRELEGNVPARNRSWSWLTLVPIDQHHDFPGFEGFIFDKVQGVVAPIQ